MDIGKPDSSEIESRASAYVAKVLGTTPDKIDPTIDFNRLGLDSTGAVALLMTLEEWLQVELAPEILFERTTIRSLSAYLASNASTSSGMAS